MNRDDEGRAWREVSRLRRQYEPGYDPEAYGDGDELDAPPCELCQSKDHGRQDCPNPEGVELETLGDSDEPTTKRTP